MRALFTPDTGSAAAAKSGAVVSVATQWRALALFALTRTMISSALLLSFATFNTPTSDPSLTAAVGLTVPGAALIYFLLSALLAAAAFFARRRFNMQVGAQLVVDLVMITTMLVLSGGLRSGMMILYLLPLAGSALLLPTSATFFVCSIAVIALLVDAVLRGLRPGAADSLVFQSGLYGAALFAISTLLRLLSARLAHQERLAHARGRDLENQLEINRLVIAQMEQGVLVVDATTQVRANNRAARVLLGLPSNAQLTGKRLADFPSLAPLCNAFVVWQQAERSSGSWSNSTIAGLARSDGGEQHSMTEHQLRARFARPPSDGGEEYVIFLDDMRKIEQRAQQLKLASMGRLTASIAHEIRNPLAAISHAGQMLGEESQDPLQQRLAGIVRENTQRLNRLVEDVLRVARREPPVGEEIELASFLKQWHEEFVRDRNMVPDVVRLKADARLVVRFEPSHLRQVLFNLVDNALRYASGNANSVEIVSERATDDNRVRIWVFDDGPGVAPEARASLFEPFYTTHARGTGLGLYLAREFCIANRGDLVYGGMRLLDGSSRSGFALRFPRVAEGGAEETGFLDTIPVQ